VLVHGAYTAQRALEADVLDEVQISQIPVLFGGGRRLFEVLPSRVELEIIRVIDNRCSRSWVSSRSASAIAVSTLAEGRAWRPCSSHVYQVKPTLASWATSSRRRPGTRRTPQSGSPASAGRSRARRERRNAPSSRRRSRTAPHRGPGRPADRPAQHP
jgi:hypothetical protein